ncbi:uncharacterized protein LOC131927975 [Physella acuta]|uniref:uncharacterized protein LOC131927975 n=1 Tax=Physella acuta TaxID=109671 RepID=UPI0027DD7BFB|nr:uncharacterized protein LOC131927975 [Physella acuta]
MGIRRYFICIIFVVQYPANASDNEGEPFYDAGGNYYDFHPISENLERLNIDGSMRALGEDSIGQMRPIDLHVSESPLSIPPHHYYDDNIRRDDVPDVKYLDENEATKDGVLHDIDFYKRDNLDSLSDREKSTGVNRLYHTRYSNNGTGSPHNFTHHSTHGYNGTTHDLGQVNSSSCDAVTHSGCDVIHYERCDAKLRVCRCLNGYLREHGIVGLGGCKAASFYHGHLTVRASGVEQSYTPQQLQPIKHKLMTLIQLTFRKQDIQGVLGLDIDSIEKQDQRMTLSFELGMDKALTSGIGEIQHVLSQELLVTSDGELLLDPTVRENTGNETELSSLFSPLVEVNPCINSEHNYCGTHAICKYTNDVMSCHCQKGYDDPSPNLYRLPGEMCIEKCSCQNGGLCIDDDVLAGTKQCSCLKWYFGSQCQIDGKEVPVICSSSVGSLIFVGSLLCCCCYCCSKHKNNNVRSRMLHFSPDISILKLPRVWMDTTTSFHENDISPENNRRMSIASESNPYFDGYILEDIPLSTLPRHVEPHTQYYQATLGHHPATMSTHSFYRY